MSRRNYPDWISAYLEYSKHSEAPGKFHFWTAVSVIAGALQRKVWIDQKYFQWLPNFYVIFVSPPGIISKSTTASIGMDLLKEVPEIRFGPASLTWQSLAKSLADCPQSIELPGPGGEILIQSAITIVASELGSLLDLKDRTMVDVLVDLWDGKKGAWEKWTKTSGNDKIENPFINILGCTTPAWIEENFSKYTVGGGFTARTIFVFGNEKRHLVAYPGDEFDAEHSKMRPALIQDLEVISRMCGEFHFHPDAKAWGKEWYQAHNKRIANYDPSMEGLNHFLARKQTFIHKVAMVLSASKRSDLTITKEDMVFAEKMVSTIEGELHQVFGRIAERDEVRDVVEVLQVLRRARSITKTALYRAVFNRMSADQFEQAMRALVASNRVTMILRGNDVEIVLKDEDAQANPN